MHSLLFSTYIRTLMLSRIAQNGQFFYAFILDAQTFIDQAWGMQHRGISGSLVSIDKSTGVPMHPQHTMSLVYCVVY